MRTAVYFVPIVTTVIALAFAGVVIARWLDRRQPHLLWWGIGLLTYAAGTITESATTLLGWHEPLFRAWYITGALLGGAPLAQGSVYLHLPRKTANRLTAIVATVIVVASLCVIASPIDYSLVKPFRLSGKVLAWRWVRLFSPFINPYAVVFLVGGAIVSAVRYRRTRETYSPVHRKRVYRHRGDSSRHWRSVHAVRPHGSAVRDRIDRAALYLQGLSAKR